MEPTLLNFTFLPIDWLFFSTNEVKWLKNDKATREIFSCSPKDVWTPSRQSSESFLGALRVSSADWQWAGGEDQEVLLSLNALGSSMVMCQPHRLNRVSVLGTWRWLGVTRNATPGSHPSWVPYSFIWVRHWVPLFELALPCSMISVPCLHSPMCGLISVLWALLFFWPEESSRKPL